MSAALAPATVAAVSDGGHVPGGEVHFFCCDPDLGLCGTRLEGAADSAEAVTCVVCADLDGQPCSAACPYPVDA